MRAHVQEPFLSAMAHLGVHPRVALDQFAAVVQRDTSVTRKPQT